MEDFNYLISSLWIKATGYSNLSILKTRNRNTTNYQLQDK